jgi:hypothetical protein
MSNPKYPLLALVAYLALIGVLAISTARPGNTQAGRPAGPDVRVVNTPAEAVPVSVQGTAKIDTSSPIPVTLQGSAKIDTTNPIPVRDVDRRPQQPVQFSLFEPSQRSYTVPAGKRLVIEYVSGGFGINSNGGAQAVVFLEVSPGSERHLFPGTPVSYNDGLPGGVTFAFSQSARMFVGSGATISLSGCQGVLLGSVNVSGYLVDVP